MGGGLKVFLALFIVGLIAGAGVKMAGAQVHHVVGDRWDSPSDAGTWSSGRTFRVGDTISFINSAAQDIIMELSSQEEYLSCDLTNPIRMFTDGSKRIPLEKEGTTYFASGTLENCKNGLKLPVEVQQSVAAATGPTPSSSTQQNGLVLFLVIGLIICYMGLM